MAKEQDGSTINRVTGGLDMNSDPVNQPDNTIRYGLNLVEETIDGQHYSKSNEPSNYDCTVRPEGFEVIGDRYIEDDKTIVICTNPETGIDEIAVVDKDNKYKTLVNTSVLGLDIHNQCDIRYRLRRGKEHVIYWVDGKNNPRTFNYDRPYNFYNHAYQNYLRAGNNPDTYVGEKWDGASFNLQKTYNKIPFFSNIEQLENGSILPGSYNFAIQLVDEDLNPTAWITTTNTTNIFNDSTDLPFARIRGSKNIDSTSQSFPRANKSIRLTITNLDTSFPYYRVAIIRASGLNGEVDKVLASDLYSTADSNFIYTGNDGSLKEVQLGDILIDSEIIFSPRHIEQLEHKLILASTKGREVNYCDFQKFASKIRTDLAFKEVLLNNVLSEPNIKNAKSKFIYTGYMPGEVASVGIVYIWPDGTTTPAFHIPGKGPDNEGSLMKVYEIESRYLDIHNCSTENYWGRDSDGNTLVGKKIRHPRFPFRYEVNKPLYTTNTGTTNITKYRLTVTITLNPAFTPTPSYPEVSGDPAVIDYSVNYKIEGNPTINKINKVLTDTDIDLTIEIYNDVTPLETVAGSEYGEIDPDSDLITAYQDGINDRFIIEFDYSNYVASSSINTDISEIFGLEFSNIEKPHPDIVGFYIVRNERLEDDRLIVDNAVFGSMTEFEQYKSAGHWMPKQFYTANNCGRIGNSGKTLGYYDKGMWFFNPEYQFFNKKSEFNNLQIEGTYEETSVDMPIISDTTGYSCNQGPADASNPNGGTKGLYINDVQAGTSYNPEVNKKKDKDDDGFDLVIGYKNTNVEFVPANTDIDTPSKKRVLFLNAASSQTVEDEVIYNVSVDNKMGIYLSDEDIPLDTLHDTGDNTNALIYAALVKDNTNAYSNFITRAYYKEHNNPIMFGDENVVGNVEIFNGGATISAVTLVSTMFYDIVVADRSKKSSVWKIIVGAVLIVAGVVLTVVGGAGIGIGALGVTLITGLAVSYGVSLAMSGIKFEQFKSMVDVDYEKGLKETVVDGAVFETIRDTIGRIDDTIRWFSDRVSNVYIESSVPVGLRAGLTGGITDFIDAPKEYNEEEFRSYLTEKLTVVDRDQGSGRLYKGYASAEVYDVNPDYMRFNKQKNFIHLPIEYDCCSDNEQIFPLRVYWSEVSFQEEKTDNYRVFLPNNYRDIEGEHGEITNLYKLGNSLFIQTKEALWHLPQNNQERVTGEIVSFIGTGEFFNVMPRKVVDDNLGSGGTSHKWSVVKTPFGVAYIDEITHTIRLHSDSLKDINGGMRSWFKENMKGFLVQQLYEKFGIQFKHADNPASANGVGYISTFDTRFNRMVFTKRDWLILPEYLEELELVATKPLEGDSFVYAIDTGKFYLGQQEVSFDNTDIFENKSWTISYSFHSNVWLSLHSYLPNYYIHNQNSMYATWVGDSSIWKFNRIRDYQYFRGIKYPIIIELVAKSNPLINSIISSISFFTKARVWSVEHQQFVEQKYLTFTKVILSNDTQISGQLSLIPKETEANATSWYANQVTNVQGQIQVSKSQGNWNISTLIDYSTKTAPIFSSKWQLIRSEYPIDKVVNPDGFSFDKNWTELERFRGKYIVMRLQFDNFENTNLIMNFSVTTEQKSIT